LTLVAERLKIRSERTVGRGDEHRLLLVADEAGNERKVIWWDGASELLPEGLFDLAYVARASTYRGTRELQVEWVDARPSPGAATVEVKVKPEVEVIDCRNVPRPREALAELATAGGVAVWREGEAAGDVPGGDRRALSRSPGLAIWTAPPGPAELRAVLAQVTPAQVYIFGIDPGSDHPDAFLRRLSGLVKHALSAREGRAPIAALAAATAQREATVRISLAWLAGRGHIRIVDLQEEEARLAPGDGRPAYDDEMKVLDARLKAALDETAAYRAYFRQAEAAALLRV
jgi:single-stranded-DNA-specific exonuclease